MPENSCMSCKHWEQNTFFDAPGVVNNSGYCTGITSALTIEIDAGYSGGVVRSIETDDNFSCAMYEKIV